MTRSRIRARLDNLGPFGSAFAALVLPLAVLPAALRLWGVATGGHHILHEVFEILLTAVLTVGALAPAAALGAWCLTRSLPREARGRAAPSRRACISVGLLMGALVPVTFLGYLWLDVGWAEGHLRRAIEALPTMLPVTLTGGAAYGFALHLAWRRFHA